MHGKLIRSVFTFTCLCFVLPLSAQTVTNGSVTGFPVGNSMLPNAPGWSVCAFSPDLCDVNFTSYTGTSQVPAVASPDGGSWLGIAALGECAQTTVTGLTPGQQYTLYFCGACFGTGSLFNSGPAMPEICVGNTCQTFTIPMVANTWNSYQMTFVANAASMVLQARMASGSDSYASLDGFNLVSPCGNPPVVQTNSDTVCLGDSVTLTATGGTGTYSWHIAGNPGNIVGNNANLTVSPTNNTSYVVTSGGSTDTAHVTVLSVTVNAGADATVCQGTTHTFTATTNGTGVSWSNGQSGLSMTTGVAGTYIATATNAFGCTSTDTVVLTVNPAPNVNLGNDTTLCIGSTLVKNVTTPNATYLWQDNSTNPTLTITQPGTYWVEVTVGNCSNADTIQVNFAPEPVIDLGNDTTICYNSSLTLDATTPGASYLWQDNSTGATLTVNFPGIYWVRVSIGGCSVTDTMQVSMAPIPAVDLGNNLTICGNNGVVLNATTTDATYLWQDNSTNATFAVTQTGTYHVTINVNGCINSDTVQVTIIPMTIIDLPDTSLCDGDSLLLDISASAGDYLWQDGSTAATYQVTVPGVYWVQVSTDSCSYTDSVMVELKDCEVAIEMPNVFSPNGDGVNDFFIPTNFKGIVQARMIIYNRWGFKVFETIDLPAGWSGEFNGAICAEGTYYWVIHYTDLFNHSETLNGFLTLVK